MPAIIRKSRKQTRRQPPRQRRRNRPIELYYWPTPNGWKISIMLEECGLPYVVRPVVESAAILQYLGRKTGKFYPKQERARVAVEEWLFWQMGGLGPMAGQAVHFRRYAPRQIAYAIARYTDEVNRLYGVMNSRLTHHEFLAGRYSIADMACVGWVRLAERQGQDLAQFPHVQRWFATVRAREPVKRAFAIHIAEASRVDMHDPKVRAVLFGQRSR